MNVFIITRKYAKMDLLSPPEVKTPFSSAVTGYCAIIH